MHEQERRQGRCLDNSRKVQLDRIPGTMGPYATIEQEKGLGDFNGRYKLLFALRLTNFQSPGTRALAFMERVIPCEDWNGSKPNSFAKLRRLQQ